MKFEEFVDYLEEVVEDPTALPDSEDDVEEMILSVTENLDLEQFIMNAPALILSLMLHQAALQGCVNLLSQGEDVSSLLAPTVH